MREKITNLIGDVFTKDSRLILADQILTLIKQELDKALLTDEEMNRCVYNGFSIKDIAQAQLDRAKKILEG